MRAFRSLRLVFGCSCLDAQTFNMSIFAPPYPKVVTKCADLGSSDRCELDVDMVDQVEATPGLSGALLAASWRSAFIKISNE